MHDIEDLENQWERYHRNKRKIYYVSAFLLLLLMFIVVGYTLYKNKNSKNILSIDSISPKNNMIQTSVIYKSLLDGPLIKLALEVNKSQDVSKFNRKYTNSESQSLPLLPIINSIPILEDKRKITKNSLPQKSNKKNIKDKKILIEKPHKKMHLNIIKSSSISSYKEVEKRFNQFQDVDDSLFLAKSYYAKKSYKKSEYWALKTNKINNSIEESWLIFAKSKVQLGYKNEAIDILLKYIQQYNSIEAKKLLLKLKK